MKDTRGFKLFTHQKPAPNQRRPFDQKIIGTSQAVLELKPALPTTTHNLVIFYENSYKPQICFDQTNVLQ